MADTQTSIASTLKQRFAQLPKVVQDAITSTDVQKQLRALAETKKLHLDQWDKLENEVMMTLFGITSLDKLEKNIRTHVGVDATVAAELVTDISRTVFAPIREELERELEHPEAKVAQTSGVEAARTQILGEEGKPPAPAAPAVAPATPPATPPSGKIERAPISESYRAGETSAQRKAVADDPYREPPL